MEFGLYFKDLRKSKDMTQETLAEAIGKTKMLISGVETGRNTSFSDEDVDKIIKALKLSDEESRKLRNESARARNRLPSEVTGYLFAHEELLVTLENMADRQLDGNSLDRIIHYAEEILNVEND